LKAYSTHEYRDNELKGPDKKDELYRSMVSKHQLEEREEIVIVIDEDDEDEEEEEEEDNEEVRVNTHLVLQIHTHYSNTYACWCCDNYC
jgi:hypothetical protein